MMKLHSFDIFDTVITRLFIHPEDVRYLVQSKAADLLPKNIADQFPRLRWKAELLARLTKKNEDVTLQDIYTRFSAITQIDIKASFRIMEIELAMEYAVSRPIAKTINTITDLRDQGSRIIFISDTCLPKETLRSLLIKNGTYQEGDGLYVSSEVGLIKRSGNMYKYVLKQENCHVNEIVHYGDNWYSDVFRPHILGIKASLCR
jgi:predicted HAD superfamily hydrolase